MKGSVGPIRHHQHLLMISMVDNAKHLASMLVDPLLTYAVKHESIDAELIAICQLDKTNTNPDVAQRAFERFKKAADTGSAFAMCMCSRFCAAGWGVPKSDADAFMWAEMATATKFAPADFEVAHCYEHGIGVPRSKGQAATLYRSAAQRGSQDAFRALKRLHDEMRPSDKAFVVEE